jgi:hypothetical protein
MPCSQLKVNRRFVLTCRLHLQDRRISQARNQNEICGKSFCRVQFIISPYYITYLSLYLHQNFIHISVCHILASLDNTVLKLTALPSIQRSFTDPWNKLRATLPCYRIRELEPRTCFRTMMCNKGRESSAQTYGFLHRPVFIQKYCPIYFSKHNFSETGFCLLLQVKPETGSSLRNVVLISLSTGPNWVGFTWRRR